MSADSTLTAGRLLVASPTLSDPNFRRAVILLLDCNDSGAIGVVLNRPTEVSVDQVLDGWGSLTSIPDHVYLGGPVQQDSALALARPVSDGDPPVGFRGVDSGVGLLELDTPQELVRGALVELRVFAGYSGWGEGQLESELEEDAWIVVDADPADIFRADTDGLWSDVLVRQGGQTAWQATKPADPTMN